MDRSHLRRNAGWLLVPVILFNALLHDPLPTGFQQPAFDEGVPDWLRVVEHLARVSLFALPFFARVGLGNSRQRAGATVYALGITAYFSSWLVQILAPASAWSQSMAGFTAPAWTPALWLAGLVLLLDDGERVRPILLFTLPLFLVLHTIHAAVAFPG